MNKIEVVISGIQKSGAFMLVDVTTAGLNFSAMMIDSGETNEWLHPGSAVTLAFKETEVSLAKNLSGMISLRNRIPCVVEGLEEGELLGKINLRFGSIQIQSVVTCRAIRSLNLQVGDHVEALIKANEMVLMRNNPLM
jgi:molybdate transport system regulatory protein